MKTALEKQQDLLNQQNQSTTNQSNSRSNRHITQAELQQYRHIPKSAIKVTPHATQRYRERVNNTNNKKEIQNVAWRARYFGANLTQLPNIANNGINFQRGTTYRLYNGYVFIFAGDHHRTLITVVQESNQTHQIEDQVYFDQM